MTKPKKDTKAKALTVAQGEKQGLIASPEFRAVNIMEKTTCMAAHFDAPDMVSELRTQIDAVKRGDMSRLEAMLITQAIALEDLFVNLTRQGMMQERLSGMETSLRLALKAQSQCRATLETLAAVKNPPIVYVKQANISQGHQQINNGVPATAATTTHAGIENKPNELLQGELTHAQLDTRSTSYAGGNDSQLAAVEKSRGEDSGRQGD